MHVFVADSFFGFFGLFMKFYNIFMEIGFFTRKYEKMKFPKIDKFWKFQKFKNLENKRIELRDDPAIQALIQKIIPDENVTFQIAHNFEGGQIRKKKSK